TSPGALRAGGHPMTHRIDLSGADLPALDCRRVRVLLGVSVLGVADPEDERSVHEHCASCPDCASTRAELDIVVPLLATVSEADATAGLPEPRPELLRRVIAETR